MQKLQSVCNMSPCAPYWFPPAVTFLLRLLLLLGGGDLGGGWRRGGRRCWRLRRRGRNALSHCITCRHGHAHCGREGASIKPRRLKRSSSLKNRPSVVPSFFHVFTKCNQPASKTYWSICMSPFSSTSLPFVSAGLQRTLWRTFCAVKIK